MRTKILICLGDGIWMFWPFLVFSKFSIMSTNYFYDQKKSSFKVVSRFWRQSPFWLLPGACPCVPRSKPWSAYTLSLRTGPGFAINWLWDYGQVILFIWVLGVLIYKMKSLDWMIKGLDSDSLMLINSLSQSIHYEWALWFTFLHCKYLKQGIFIYS